MRTWNQEEESHQELRKILSQFLNLFPFSCLLNLPLLICFGSFGELMDIGGSPRLPHLTPYSQERNSDWPSLYQVLIPGPITCWRRGGDA